MQTCHFSSSLISMTHKYSKSGKAVDAPLQTNSAYIVRLNLWTNYYLWFVCTDVNIVIALEVNWAVVRLGSVKSPNRVVHLLWVHYVSLLWPSYNALGLYRAGAKSPVCKPEDRLNRNIPRNLSGKKKTQKQSKSCGFSTYIYSLIKSASSCHSFQQKHLWLQHI